MEEEEAAHRLKLKLSITVAIAVVACVTLLLLQPHGTVEYGVFNEKFHQALRRDGGTIQLDASCHPDLLPLPAYIRWHPTRWHAPDWRAKITLGIGSPNGAERCVVRSKEGHDIDCYVRYLDSRACYIEIRAPAESRSSSGRLRSQLEEAFPGLPIRCATH